MEATVGNSPKAIVGEILAAIDTELKTVKRSGATSRITLVAGIRITTALASNKSYRFEMLIQRSFPEGSQGKLVSQGRSTDARVIRIDGQYIWLETNDDFGNRIPHSYFDVDLSFLLEDLKSKYEAVLAGQITVGSPGVNLLLINTAANPIRKLSALRSMDYLSLEQHGAVEKLISLEIGALHGPPGTGKTRTLAGMLVDCFYNEEKILVCGNTNRSIDEALEAFKRAAKKCIPDEFEEGIKAGRILRKGINVFPEEGPKIPNPDEIVFGVRKSLQEELDSVRKNIRDNADDLKTLNQIKYQLISRGGLRSEIINEEKKYADNDKKTGDNNKEIGKCLNKVQAISRMGFFTRLFKRGRVEALQTRMRVLEAENAATAPMQSKILRNIAFLKSHETEAIRKLSELGQGTESLTLSDIDRKIVVNGNELERHKRKARDLEQALEGAPQAVLVNARIVFATLSKCHLDSDINRTRFDRVFVDEASMAPLPQLFLAGFRANKSICIFGDPKQLAPICISNRDEVRRWFAVDIYKYANLGDTSKNESSVASLITQRRMPPELGEVISELFYEGKLQHDWEEGTKPVLSWMGNHKIGLLNTTDQGAFCNRHEIGRGYSRLNIVHAVIALSILREAEAQGIRAAQMAYITPYRAQAEFLGSLIMQNRKVHGENFMDGLRWGTVHRFQGGEADLVIYDTCESPRELPTRLTGGAGKSDIDDPEIDDASRLHCVALSRARSQLVILANLTWLRETLPVSSKLSEIINKMSINGLILPVPEQHSALRLFSKDLLPGLLFPDLKGANYVLCDESNFYSVLENDIKSSRRTVTIISPYLGEKRISLFEGCLRFLASNRIKTIIWTKDPSDLATRSESHKRLALRLESLGAEVQFRPGTHEKALIIDDTISYYGSLNPLSSISTKETMLRIVDTAFAKALIDHLGISDRPKDQGPKPIQKDILGKLGLISPETKIEEEKARKLLKKLRWIIAGDKGLPVQATLWSRTIDWLMTTKPNNIPQLYSCEEFTRNRTNISGYEESLLKIISLIRE